MWSPKANTRKVTYFTHCVNGLLVSFYGLGTIIEKASQLYDAYHRHSPNACLILERNNYSLTNWVKHKVSSEGRRQGTQSRQAAQTARAIEPCSQKRGQTVCLPPLAERRRRHHRPEKIGTRDIVSLNVDELRVQHLPQFSLTCKMINCTAIALGITSDSRIEVHNRVV